MDVNPVNDNVGHMLYRNAGTVGNVDIGSSAVNCLVTVHEELFFELDDHVPLKNDPQRLCLNNSMAQGARPGIDRIVVIGISDHIESAILPSNGILAEPNGAVCEPLSIVFPIWIAAPAVVDGVPGSAREIT
jgi:hypothetical protein